MCILPDFILVCSFVCFLLKNTAGEDNSFDIPTKQYFHRADSSFFGKIFEARYHRNEKYMILESDYIIHVLHYMTHPGGLEWYNLFKHINISPAKYIYLFITFT